MNRIDFVHTDCEDYALHTGVTFLVDMLVYQECNNLPNDLTGYTGVIRVFNEVETSIIVEIPGVVTEPTRGVIHFELSAAETQDLPLGLYSHQIELTSSAGIVYRMSEGEFEVAQ